MSGEENGFFNTYVDFILRFRWLVIVVSFVGIGLLATGARHLELQQNYRMFFGPNNPQLKAFDALEKVYTKIDNHIFVVHNPNGSVFTADVMSAVRELTDEGWTVPHSTRVDSIVNYQHSWALEDDLMVEDLIPEGEELNPDAITRAREVSIVEPIIMGNIVSHDEDTTVVSIRVQLDPDDVLAVREAAEFTLAMLMKSRETHPDLRIELTGTAVMSDAFGSSPQRDSKTVFPAMFVLLAVFMFLFTRSVGGTIATWFVIFLSAAGAMGASGYYGYGVNPANMAAPVVVLTLAIADSIHILLSMFKEMNKGSDKLTALRESLRINAQPVFLTSLTTSIGFLVMNFSDSPPFQELGNITATGVGLAWLLSMSFLPAMLSVVPIRAHKSSWFGEPLMLAFAEINIKHRRKLVAVVGGSVVFFIASISRMEIDDAPHKYFHESILFRSSTDFFDEEMGFYGFYMSVLADEPGGINDPQYLASLDRFSDWLREQPGVEYVGAYSEIAKKLNMNMHGDDAEFRVVPDSRELAAQYLLLYEMSLPLGMDLNDQINVDKSATRLSVNFRASTIAEVADVGDEAEAWLIEHGVNAYPDHATGPPVMFSKITETNIKSMVKGTLLGFVLIAIVLMISLRSATLGLLSMIPNIVPAATAFGIWALVVGEAGFAISVVAGLSIGIIVDDTVHFLSKYSRARRELGLNSEDAVRYAFTTVGQALLDTSIIVAGGFSVLMLRTFRVASFMGALTALTIVCALVADFLLLPAILLILDRRDMTGAASDSEQEAA